MVLSNTISWLLFKYNTYIHLSFNYFSLFLLKVIFKNYCLVLFYKIKRSYDNDERTLLKCAWCKNTFCYYHLIEDLRYIYIYSTFVKIVYSIACFFSISNKIRTIDGLKLLITAISSLSILILFKFQKRLNLM